MMERRKPVQLRVSTVYRLRQLQTEGESLDAVVRRLAGLLPTVAQRPGPVAAPRPMASSVPRETKYAALDRMAVNEIITIPWQFDDRGQIVRRQPAVVAAVARCSRLHGWRFVEQVGSGQGTRWLRLA